MDTMDVVQDLDTVAVTVAAAVGMAAAAAGAEEALL